MIVPKSIVRAILLMGLFCGAKFLLDGCSSKKIQPDQVYNKAYHDSVDAKILDTFIANHPVLAGDTLKSVMTTSSGLRYCIIQDTGTTAPTSLSNVTFSYSIRIPSISRVLDSVPNPFSTSGYNITPLGNTFAGLSEGIQLIHNQGHIILFIPSSLGFRDERVNLSYTQLDQTILSFSIPPNSVLIYNIYLSFIL